MNKNKIKICVIFSVLIIFSQTFALNSGSGVLDGFSKAKAYLDYALYAMSALGAIGVGFMLFSNHNDAVLKHVARWAALTGVLATAYQAPTWFGLNIFM